MTKKNQSIMLLICLISWVSICACSSHCHNKNKRLLCHSKPLTALNHKDMCASVFQIKVYDTVFTEAKLIENKEKNDSYCHVAGIIGANIKFELNLPSPDQWNEKMLMVGNSGFAGYIEIEKSDQARIEKGYATVATNTGHDIVSGAQWAHDNIESMINFGYRAVHQTAITAKSIIETYYNKPIRYSYFQGCSRGGSQGVMAAIRYPSDFDGIIAGAPALSWTNIGMQFFWNQKLLYPKANQLAHATLDPKKLLLLHQMVINQCDEIDGLKDGLIDDPRKCHLDFSKLKCSKKTSDCLSDRDIHILKQLYQGPHNSKGLIYPGIALGSEGDPTGWFPLVVGPFPDSRLQGLPNFQYYYANGLKYLFFNDPTFQFQSFDFENQIKELSFAGRVLNATQTNLQSFYQLGGKLILYHGWADALLPPSGTVQYYEKIVNDPMNGGVSNVYSFCRLFMLPGVCHCEGGYGPGNAGVENYLTHLEHWVETNQPPDSIIASYVHPTTQKIERQRPICAYPQKAQWIDGCQSKTYQDPINDPNCFQCVDTQ